MKKKFRALVLDLIKRILKYPDNYNYSMFIEQGLLEIGRYTYGIPIVDVYPDSERKVTIGSFCSISKEVRIITGGIHPTDWVSTFPIRVKVGVDISYDGMPTSKGEINIGHDVWIGTGATILSGVNIGSGAIIAACSMVTKDVPPYAIVTGIPAQVIRYRFTLEQINELLKIEWWFWDIEKIKSNVHLLSSPNIDTFIEKFKIPKGLD